MVHELSRKRKYALLLALTIVVLAVAATSNLVSADPCSAYLSQPTISGASYNPNTSLIVPVSATCPTISGPLYAVGDAYDTTTNTDLGSVNTALTPVNGISAFNGQLAFNLPPVAQGDIVQITASIYSGAYGSQTGPQLTTTTIQINPNSLAPANTQDPSSSPSQYCGSGPNCNYPNGSNGNSYPYSQGSQGSYGNYQHHHHSNYASQYQQQQTVTITQPVPVPLYLPPDNSWLIDLVITAVIAIAVVGAIAFAILASRNRHPQTRPY
ncbi:MAG: hypothetical protein ACLPY5_00350 [Candidatus Bathyarchaeia archaeon]